MGSSEGALYFETRYYGLAVGQAEATLELRLNFRISIVLHEIIQIQNSIMQPTEILRPLLQIIFSLVMAFFSKNVLSHYPHHDPMFHFQPLSGTVARRQSEIENKRLKEQSQLKQINQPFQKSHSIISPNLLI
jgi:hypothetical protein